jgi:L-fuconolactonase
MKHHRIDAHQHFWNYDPQRHTWMSENMNVLKTNLLPIHLLPHLETCGLAGCVAVQADQSEDENTFLLQLAENQNFIQGIVGWIDLKAKNIEERLAYYQQFPKMKGFRHLLQDEAQRDFMLIPAFMEGVAKLKKYDYTYDILIFTDQMPYALEFIKAFPEQSFVIDHIGKPMIKQQIIGDWEKHMKAFANFPNLYCKISGLVTEADWQHWKKEDFRAYLDIVVEAFGMDRIMYGSDWPVCLLAATYETQFDTINNYFSGFSTSEQNKFFGENAIKFYRL